MDEFVAITLKDSVTTQFINLLSSQLIVGMKKRKPALNEMAALRIVQTEVRRGIAEVNADIMNKNFTMEEITELLEFFKSPIGQKYLGMSAVMARELPTSLRRIIPEVQRRIDTALEKEGALP